MNYKHAILIDNQLKGWQYGMQRELEKEIIRQTNAEVVTIPGHPLERTTNYIEHGRRLDFLRGFIPRHPLKVEADVVWLVLMGPFEYDLDVFKDWYKDAKYRVVYVFDTLEQTASALKSVFSSDAFNLCITSFNDAVPFMEKLTQRKWYSIEQGVPENFFEMPSAAERVIPFSSYGRRLPKFHDALKEFTAAHGLYYDYSVFDGSHTTTFDPQMYQQYAWHISHSIFNVNWPVEITSPSRAGNLHPITCRWFEVAAAGTCILGKQPNNPYFRECLHPDLVVEADPFADRHSLFATFERIWKDHSLLLEKARQVRNDNIHRWTWTNRVARMLNLLSS